MPHSNNTDPSVIHDYSIPPSQTRSRSRPPRRRRSLAIPRLSPEMPPPPQRNLGLKEGGPASARRIRGRKAKTSGRFGAAKNLKHPPSNCLAAGRASWCATYRKVTGNLCPLFHLSHSISLDIYSPMLRQVRTPKMRDPDCVAFFSTQSSHCSFVRGERSTRSLLAAFGVATEPHSGRPLYLQ